MPLYLTEQIMTLHSLSNGDIFNDVERPIFQHHAIIWRWITQKQDTLKYQGCHVEWPWVILSDLAKYSMTRSTRSLSATAELLVISILRNTHFALHKCHLLIGLMPRKNSCVNTATCSKYLSKAPFGGALEWLSKIFNDTKHAQSVCDSWASCYFHIA